MFARIDTWQGSPEELERWIARARTEVKPSVLQDRGHKVALVTDGRMSGASGKVPAAIHVTPEALAGGAIGKVRDGDMVRLDAENRYVCVPKDLSAFTASR